MTKASFQPQGYLLFDLSQGRVSSPNEKRHLVVPADLIMAAGDVVALEEAALRWGQEQGRVLASLVGDDILEQPPERFVTELSHFLATLGWGWCKLESRGGVLFVVVQRAPRGGAMVILASFLAGAFSAASGQKLACLPINNDEAQHFLLTDPELADNIRIWIDGGAHAEEVALRMLRGEHVSKTSARGSS